MKNTRIGQVKALLRGNLVTPRLHGGYPGALQLHPRQSLIELILSAALDTSVMTSLVGYRYHLTACDTDPLQLTFYFIVRQIARTIIVHRPRHLRCVLALIKEESILLG